MRSAILLPILVLLPAVLGGCDQYGYRYKPVGDSTFYDPVSADYRETEKTLDVLVDTRGRRLDRIRIARSDGTLVDPTGMDYPPFVSRIIGGTAVPIEGPERADGPTVAHFDKKAIGPKPWAVHAEVRGLPAVLFQMGG